MKSRIKTGSPGQSPLVPNAKKFSRRTFLRATGASPFLLPLLEPQLARAGCLPNPPKRALFVIWGNGALPDPANARTYWPAGPSETNFTLPAHMKSLEPFKNDLLFIDALNYQWIQDTPLAPGDSEDARNGHSAVQGLLTGKRYLAFGGHGWLTEPAGPSIDQHLGGVAAGRGFGGIPSLYLGVRLWYPMYAVWRAARVPVAADVDPSHVFDTLFAGRTGGAPDPELERLRRARKSVLDSVGRDFARFGRLLGTADRARVESHLDSVRSLENQLLAARAPLACQIPDKINLDGISVGTLHYDNTTPKRDAMQDAKIPQLLKLQMDLLVAAMATDVVRVAVLQLTDTTADDCSLPWLGLSDTYHNIAHQGGDAKLSIDRWVYSQWAYLVGQLKNEKEGDKSVLDSSVVAFMNNMTHGGHPYHDVPSFLAGSCGGYFKTGRNLTNRSPGQYHHPLLVSIANAMEVPLTSWGDPEYNSGEMPGLRG